MTLYYALTDDFDTVIYFFDLQEIIDGSSSTQKPVIDLLVSVQTA